MASLRNALRPSASRMRASGAYWVMLMVTCSHMGIGLVCSACRICQWMRVRALDFFVQWALRHSFMVRGGRPGCAVSMMVRVWVIVFWLSLRGLVRRASRGIRRIGRGRRRIRCLSRGWRWGGMVCRFW